METEQQNMFSILDGMDSDVDYRSMFNKKW